MTIFLLMVIGTLIVVLIQQYRYRRRIVKTSTRLIGNLNYENQRLKDRLHEEVANYHALDIGQQEIVDNYENDLLDMREKKEAALNSAKYDREQRERVEEELERINKVIEDHSTKCETIVEDIAEALLNDILPPSE